MVTRVRIEAEGSSLVEVESTLQAAFDTLASAPPPSLLKMFGEDVQGVYPGLVEARMGEFVIERFAKNVPGEPPNMREPGPGHGTVFYRGRMTSHYAKPSKAMGLAMADFTPVAELPK